MPLRTIEKAVIGVLRDDYDAKRKPLLTPYLETANSITDQVIACAAARGRALTDKQAELVERWLAAHYYTRSDKPYSQRSTGRASGAFQGRTEMHLEASFYGQTALELDPSGCLLKISKGIVGQVSWVGKNQSEQIDYVDRN